MIRAVRKITGTIPRFFNSSKKQIQPQREDKQDKSIQVKVEHELMEDKYEAVKMQGLEDRNITGIDSFQRQILKQNSFDLLDPKINPRVASMSTTMGLELGENQQLAQVNLGKIKVKKQNQVFLSEIDPNNIPEYYDIVFDYEKQMSLVGKRIDEEEQQSSQMTISTRKAFQERTQKEISRQIIGISLDPFMNSRLAWKQNSIVFMIAYLFLIPLVATQSEEQICKESIHGVEKERLKEIIKIKQEACGDALLSNPDMRLV